ncbi:MAG: hypothetical protein AAFN11_20810 [Chloroflexota bacterium]
MALLRVGLFLLIASVLTACATSKTTVQIVTPLPDGDGHTTRPIPTRPSLRDLDAVTTITFKDLYDGFDENNIQIVSDEIQALDGTEVRIAGYVAPQLNLRADWFALTREMVLVCPFCVSIDDWVSDVIIVYTDDWSNETKNPVMVIGTLEVGGEVDELTGMFSLVRIRDAEVTTIR